LTGVRLENRDYLISIGNAHAEPLNEALRIATTDMVRWLQQEYRLEDWAAHQLIGVQAFYDIATVAGTVALKIPKAALPK
jgi:amidase